MYDRSASPPPTYEEDRIDRQRLKTLASAVEEALSAVSMDTESATRWRDRWRVPLRFESISEARVAKAHFDAVHACGGNLVVEEGRVDDESGHAFYVEMSRTKLRGFKAWSPRDRSLCLAGALMMLGCASYIYHVHLEPFLYNAST